MSGQSDLRTAQRLYEEGKYGDAAEYYEKAWRLRTEKRDLIYRAGECYYWIKDYRKAADCYQFVKHDNEEFALVGLKYARSLKQDGRYREAMEEFKWFARDYKGPGKDDLDKIIVNDIKGCELGIELSTSRKPKELPVEVQILPEWVNSIENEFAPVPYTDDLLYFSSMIGGKAKLYRTSRNDGQWQTPIEPQGLPNIAAEHFGNGAFSPDGSRFYFTQCNAINPDIVGGNGLRAHCEISVLRKTTAGWGQPERLRDYINLPNSTNTHPFIVHENGREFLFFASDREGGFGGFDLYMCDRPLDSDELDFSFPQNLGEKVNTGGEEITPFFDPNTQTLYFSSNGLVSLGGLDVFKTIRSGNKWTKPENLGVPFNSTCDDFFFSLKKSSNGGFFVSNRLYGRAKTSTRHEDIFEFFPRETKIFITGKILNNDGTPIKECMIGLYETIQGEEPRLLQVRPSADGSFKFPILADRTYSIEATKDGFQPAFLLITNQYANTQGGYDVNIVLRPETNAPVGGQPEPTKTTQGSTDRPNKFPKPTENGRTTGTIVYKIQLEAMPALAEADPRYDSVRKLGILSAEPIPEKGLQRIMLGDFTDKKKVNDLARQLRSMGFFQQAFVVSYADGRRQ